MKEIITYLKEKKKYKMIHPGKAPYWMFNFGDKSEEYDENNHVITIWFEHDKKSKQGILPANVEINENMEGKCYFNGHISSLDDLKKILSLIFDSK